MQYLEYKTVGDKKSRTEPSRLNVTQRSVLGQNDDYFV